MNSKKGRQVDSSIAQAYIQLIRHAENFIYIENQYFLGSAYSWLINDDVNCHHTIPSEITQRIIEKIRMNQRFTAYVMIPMFPEGDPASMPIQEILYWQTRTIEMMYSRIGEEIRNTNSPTHPTDWLLFLCPGKKGTIIGFYFSIKLTFKLTIHRDFTIWQQKCVILVSHGLLQITCLIRDSKQCHWRPA